MKDSRQKKCILSDPHSIKYKLSAVTESDWWLPGERSEKDFDQVWGSFGRWWKCSLSWLWWRFHRFTSTSKITKLRPGCSSVVEHLHRCARAWVCQFADKTKSSSLLIFNLLYANCASIKLLRVHVSEFWKFLSLFVATTMRKGLELWRMQAVSEPVWKCFFFFSW
jgi:hypothetical protein